MANPKHFLLISHNGSNLGDAAIAASTIQHIRSKYPDAHIVLESSYPDVSAGYFNDIEIMPRFFTVKKIVGSPAGRSVAFIFQNLGFVIATLSRAIWLWLSSLLGIRSLMPRLLKEAKDADTVLSIAGDSISQRYAWYLRFLELSAISRLKKPIIIYSQSIGPFNGQFAQRWAGRALSLTSLILARDDKTVKLLHEYGATTKIVRTADTAISLIPDYSKRVKELTSSDLIGNHPIAMVIRTDIYSNIEPAAYQKYLVAMEAVIKSLQQKGHKVVLTGSIREDLTAAKKFISAHSVTDCEIVTLPDYRPAEAKAILGTLGLVISPRMHPVILSSSMGTPVYGLIQEFKLSAYLGDLGLEPCQMPIDNIDVNKMQKGIQDMLTNRQKYLDKMHTGLGNLRKLSLSNAEYL